MFLKQVTIGASTVTTMSPTTVTATMVQAATTVMSPGKVTITSPAKVTTMSPPTVPATSQTTSVQVSTTEAVGLHEPTITAGLAETGIPTGSVAAGHVVKTVPQQIDSTDLDTTPSRVNSTVVIQLLSVKYLKCFRVYLF